MPDVADSTEKTNKARSRTVSGIDCNPILVQVGRRIKARRQALGMSQAELAKALGVEQNAVSQYENAQVDLSICRITHIAQVLEITVGDLLPVELRLVTSPGMSSPDISHRVSVLVESLRALRARPSDTALIERLKDEIIAELERALVSAR